MHLLYNSRLFGMTVACFTFKDTFYLHLAPDPKHLCFRAFQFKPMLPKEASTELPFKSEFKSFIVLDPMIIKTNALD